MGPTRKPLGKVGAAIISTVVASLAIAGPVAATSHVTVTGESVESIVLTLDDANAEFGNLTPSNVTATGADVAKITGYSGPFTANANDGACYAWDSHIDVQSNVAYDVSVTPNAANIYLDFLSDSTHASYADCIGGTAISGVTPIAWLDAQPLTDGQEHAQSLSLQVDWATGSGVDLGQNSTLTFSAVADL